MFSRTQTLGALGGYAAKAKMGNVRALSVGGEDRDKSSGTSSQAQDPAEGEGKGQAEDKPGAGGEEMPIWQKALEFSKKLDPAEGKRQSLPTGLFGNFRIHWLANISMFERAWVGMALGLINRGLDPDFELDDIMEGATTAYRVIRQISSNAKTAEEMALLTPFVSANMLEVLTQNLENASATDRNTGLHVHDVCGEVVDVKLRFEPGEDIEAPASLEEQRQRGTELLRRAQWLQLKVRFVALETELMRGGGGGAEEEVTEIATSLRPSTWTLEGQVWELLDPEAGEDVSPIENRKRNPEAAWQLTAIGL